jgi:hypothetical protein
LLEIISIVIAVLLALAAGQAVDAFRAAQRTHEALGQIRQEIANDDTVLRAVHPLHVRLGLAFERTVGDAAPHGFNPFGGTTTAWELARGTDVLAGVPYSVRSALQTRYAEVQNLDALNAAMLGRLEVATTDQDPNFYFTAFALQLMFKDIEFSERRLASDDRAALDALAKDGIHP